LVVPQKRIEFNKESISALTHKRETEWEKIIKADFLTEDEKREYFGFPPKPKTGKVK
jgi:phage portal protein BeeE